MQDYYIPRPDPSIPMMNIPMAANQSMAIMMIMQMGLQMIEVSTPEEIYEITGINTPETQILTNIFTPEALTKTGLLFTDILYEHSCNNAFNTLADTTVSEIEDFLKTVD